MTYLTAPETKTAKKTYRYYVELHSIECDYEGVTIDYCMVDCVVTEPTLKAIEELIAAAVQMEGYKIAYCWVPTDCDEF